MMTFPHTTPHGEGRDRPPSILPGVLLVICGIVLLPFTLLGLLGWLVSRLLPRGQPS
jgi:hypothetical protein